MLNSWINILEKYPSGKRPLYVEGAKMQPEFSFSADVNYHGRPGSIKFTWFNSAISNPIFLPLLAGVPENLFRKEKYDREGYAYSGVTQLYFELPSDKYFFKIFKAGLLLNFIYKIHPLRTQTGDLNFDARYISLEKPAGIIQPLVPVIIAIAESDLHKSMMLTTDCVEPQTARPYLQLRINHLITDEKELESLFLLCNNLIAKLYKH